MINVLSTVPPPQISKIINQQNQIISIQGNSIQEWNYESEGSRISSITIFRTVFEALGLIALSFVIEFTG